MSKTNEPKISKDRIAIHEAGHTIMAIDLSLKIKKISILPHNGHLGIVFFEKKLDYICEEGPITLELRYEGEKRAKCLLGGPEAEKVLLKFCISELSMYDYACVRYYLEPFSLDDDSRDKHKAWLESKVKYHLKCDKTTLRKLSDELLEKEELSYEEAKKIVRDARFET